MKALVSTVLVFGLAGGAAAQSPAAAPSDAAAKDARYQIGQMERMLEGAVEHASKNMRDRLQAVVPVSTLISETASVRGFRLEGYGVFFDVSVPSMDLTFPWTFRTLDQNDLGLQSALKALRQHVESSGDRDLQQALRRVELQIDMPAASAAAPSAVNARQAVGSVASTSVDVTAAAAPARDPILANPNEAYRAEIRQALMDAMLDYSGPLAVPPDEWLTLAARRNDEPSPLTPFPTADSDARTLVIRIKGDDLAAFRAGRLTREEALKKIEVRVF